MDNLDNYLLTINPLEAVQAYLDSLDDGSHDTALRLINQESLTFDPTEPEEVKLFMDILYGITGLGQLRYTNSIGGYVFRPYLHANVVFEELSPEIMQVSLSNTMNGFDFVPFDRNRLR